MSSIRFIPLLIALFVLCVSCQKQQSDNQSGDAVTVKLPSCDETLTVADLVDVVDWIELSAENDIYIDNVKRLAVLDGEYYLFDNVKHKCVLRYDTDGRFANRIGTCGQGAGEYTAAIDFCVDKNSGRIIILSRGSELFIYDINGVFDRKVEIEGDWREIAMTDCGLMATSDNMSTQADGDNYLIGLFDNDFKLVDRWYKYPKPLVCNNLFFANGLVTVDGNGYYADNFNHVIYQLKCTENEAVEKIRLKLNNAMPEVKYLDLMSFFECQRDYNWIKDMIILPSGFIVGYIYNGNFSVLYSDRNGNIITSGIFVGVLPTGVSDDSGQIVSPVSPELYSAWAENYGIKKADFEVSDNTNMLLLKWKAK